MTADKIASGNVTWMPACAGMTEEEGATEIA